MIELIGTIVAVVAITGVVLNNRRHRVCFVLWMISNSLSVLIHCLIGLWSLAAKDLIFLVLSIEGYFLWRRKEKKSEGPKPN